MRGRGAAVRAEGAAARSAEAANELALSQKASPKDFLTILRPYFWPAKVAHRVAAVFCFTFLGLSKVCNIAAPAFLGYATDQITRGDLKAAINNLLLFVTLRFLTSVFDESQRLVYLRVKEVAGHEISCRSFAHLHTLSYSWHVSKRTGVVLRAMDRGVGSASTVVEMLFLRLVPTVVEMLVLVYLFATVYGSPGSSGVLALSFVGYFIATYVMTQWRTRIRAKANLADNDASAIATDSLVGFEVVKAFSAEKAELDRYSEAVKRLQQASRQNQGSLVALNLTQSFIMRAALGGVLVVSAMDVVNGHASIGSFVAMQTWVVQLFMPLSWLGSLYSMILSAMTDMGNLASLLKEEPSVKDAPNASLLQLKDKHHGAEVVFEHVNFAYPTARDNVETIMEAQRKAIKDEEEKRKSLSYKIGAAFNRVKDVVTGRTKGAVKLDDDQQPVDGGADAAAGRGSKQPVSLVTDWPSASAAAPVSPAPSAGADSLKIQINPAAESPGPGISDGGGGHKPATNGVGGFPAKPSKSVDDGASAAAAGAGTGVIKPVLQDISFRIPPGKTLAVIGSTGSGKSTLSRLLFRYYDPASGRVLIDGQDARDVTQSSLRSAIGIVPQDAVLFNSTIKYNIAYGRPGATDAEIVEAAKAAQIWDFICGLKEGLDTKVGERGLKLSGGEKQRVAIARTLLKDPPILVLDEATSALDSLTEADVQAAVARARQGRTVLVIAHRLSTIRDADEIIVLDGGRIVERGSHEELIASGPGGRYFAMWSQQAAMSAALISPGGTVTSNPAATASADNGASDAVAINVAAGREGGAPGVAGPAAASNTAGRRFFAETGHGHGHGR